MASEQSQCFKAFVDWTKKHHANWNLGPVMKNGKFSHFFDADTDTAWIGFEAAWNTRPAPAATDTGLETVAPNYITYNPVYHVTYEGADPKRGYVYVQANTCPASVEALKTVAWDTWGGGLRSNLKSQPKPGDDALVYRSQAEKLLAGRDAVIERQADSIDKLERKVRHWQDRADKADEVLAAERAKYRDAMEKLVESQRETLVWQQRAINLKADNAALTARIKELEERIEAENLYQHEALEEDDARVEALEAKLAAAEKFIQFCADGFFVTDDELRGAARAVLGGKPSC